MYIVLCYQLLALRVILMFYFAFACAVLLSLLMLVHITLLLFSFFSSSHKLACLVESKKNYCLTAYYESLCCVRAVLLCNITMLSSFREPLHLFSRFPLLTLVLLCFMSISRILTQFHCVRFFAPHFVLIFCHGENRIKMFFPVAF